MSSRSYVGALKRLLEPYGFERQGWDFIRNKDGFRDRVSLQVSQFAGITVNVHTEDLTTEALLEEIAPSRSGLYLGDVRLPSLAEGNDRWWRRDPNGPAEVSEMVLQHGLPYFESLRSLEAQAKRYGREGKGWGPAQLHLAVTLYRLGQVEEACRRLEAPPRLWRDYHLPKVEAMRRWLGCEQASQSVT